MEVKKRLIAYWANKFTIAPENFEQPGNSFFPRLNLNKHQRVIIFQTKEHNFIFYPEIYHESLSRLNVFEKLIKSQEKNLHWSNFSLEKRGTDYYYYWMSPSPQNINQSKLRLLQPSDQEKLKTLWQSVTSRERELGYVDLQHPVAIGWFSEGKLLSAGSLIIEEEIADIGILSHPEARGQGIGKQVVQSLIANGLTRNKLVQYSSMKKNRASVALAESLGFERFATETYWGIT